MNEVMKKCYLLATIIVRGPVWIHVLNMLVVLYHEVAIVYTLVYAVNYFSMLKPVYSSRLY